MPKNWIYASLGIAVAALAVALVAMGTTLKGPLKEPEKVSVYAKFNNITIPYSGYYLLTLGWIKVDKDVLLYINVTAIDGHVYSIYINGVEYSNPATVWLTPGNHTVSVMAYVSRKTHIKIEYKVGT